MLLSFRFCESERSVDRSVAVAVAAEVAVVIFVLAAAAAIVVVAVAEIADVGGEDESSRTRRTQLRSQTENNAAAVGEAGDPQTRSAA